MAMIFQCDLCGRTDQEQQDEKHCVNCWVALTEAKNEGAREYARNQASESGESSSGRKADLRTTVGRFSCCGDDSSCQDLTFTFRQDGTIYMEANDESSEVTFSIPADEARKLVTEVSQYQRRAY